MKIAVHLARNRRLLAWLLLSAFLHLCLLFGIERPFAPTPLAEPGQPLALRLAPPSPAAPAPPPSPAPPPPAEQLAPPPLATAPAAAAPAVPEPAVEPEPIPSPPDAPTSSPPAAPAMAAAPLGRTPGFYRVRLPPPARLAYAVTRTRPGGQPETEPDAEIVWEREGGKYGLRIDGVLGWLESRGGNGDGGIAPATLGETGPAGSTLVTRFNQAEGRIEFLNGSAPLPMGAQDRASLLMQLSAIGLADPDQVDGMLDFALAGADGARIVRFQVLGQATLATGVGNLATVHLAQVTEAGTRRIELWLAPRHSWMPVQIRVTEADGSVANQVVTSIEAASASGEVKDQ